jgi:Sulfotransferase family
MISHRYKSIFIHQRKNAGTSILNSFGFRKSFFFKRKFLPAWCFSSWDAYNKGVLSVKPDWENRPEDYYVFAVIRNPWDRFVSGWKYCKSTKSRSLLDVLENLPEQGHDYRHLTRLQCETLLDKNGELITDFLIRYEYLQEDYDIVCDKIGKPRKKLHVMNTSRREHYSSYFKNDLELSLFENHYRKDIEMFDYTF